MSEEEERRAAEVVSKMHDDGVLDEHIEKIVDWAKAQPCFQEWQNSLLEMIEEIVDLEDFDKTTDFNLLSEGLRLYLLGDPATQETLTNLTKNAVQFHDMKTLSYVARTYDNLFGDCSGGVREPAASPTPAPSILPGMQKSNDQSNTGIAGITSFQNEPKQQPLPSNDSESSLNRRIAHEPVVPIRTSAFKLQFNKAQKTKKVNIPKRSNTESAKPLPPIKENIEVDCQQPTKIGGRTRKRNRRYYSDMFLNFEDEPPESPRKIPAHSKDNEDNIILSKPEQSPPE